MVQRLLCLGLPDEVERLHLRQYHSPLKRQLFPVQFIKIQLFEFDVLERHRYVGMTVLPSHGYY